MKRALLTVCTSDYYQYYIPLFVWSALDTWNDIEVLIYVRGEICSDVKEAMELIQSKNYRIYENYKTDYPYLSGTTNALRLTVIPDKEYEELMITDIDFFFSSVPLDIFSWNKLQLELMHNDCYVAHHGAYERPKRPQICTSWRGNFERIACGFVLLFPNWFKRTKDQVIAYDSLLKAGKWGHFRESDEVMLFRIVRDVGLPIAPKVPFPRVLRYYHLGDLKDSMKHRYTDRNMMSRLLDQKIAKNYLDIIDQPCLNQIIEIVSRSLEMNKILQRARECCNMIFGGRR